ncbi:MAG TPA: hypothetical protein VK099_06930 [Alcanivoracaceae bacterium]|nr:hypothetical protein [Alcanivoracaceae bacterium]
MFTHLVIMVIIAIGLLIAPYQIARRQSHTSQHDTEDDHDTHEQRR